MVEVVNRKVFLCYLDTPLGKSVAKKLFQLSNKEPEEGEEVTRRTTYTVCGLTSDNYQGPEKIKYVESVCANEKDAIVEAVLDSDLIIWDINPYSLPKQKLTPEIKAARWALDAINLRVQGFEHKKTFVCISSLMSWAKTLPVDKENPGDPFPEDVYRRRRPHLDFEEFEKFEKDLAKAQVKGSLATYVIGAGVQYGCGEWVLHYLFKAAWELNAAPLPIFGGGQNFLPMIHVDDLSSIVMQVGTAHPANRYFVAVDSNNETTLQMVVETVSKSLGTKESRLVDREDALLEESLSLFDVDLLTTSLRFEAAAINEFEFEWVAKDGFVATIEKIIGEFKETRGLTPLRVFVGGPPGSGKSYWAQKLSRHYKIPVIALGAVIAEVNGFLPPPKKAPVEGEEPAEEEEPEPAGDEEEEEHPALTIAKEAKEQLETPPEEGEENPRPAGRYSDDILIKMLKWKLSTRPCTNQGWILDGFPKTVDQAKALCLAGDDEEGDGDDEDDAPGKVKLSSSAPANVIVLEARDAVLKDRIMNLPESEVAGTHNNEEGLDRRLTAYHASNTGESSVALWFDEVELHPKMIGAENMAPEANEQVLADIVSFVGEAHNYGLTKEELAQQEKERQAEMEAAEAKEKAAEDARRAEELAEREQKEAAEKARKEVLLQEERDALEVKSLPLRTFLMENVIPSLTKALVEVAKVRPEDPVDYVAEYLFKNNPDSVDTGAVSR